MNERIVFVEDDPTIAEVVSDTLRGKGWEVQPFDSADELLQESALRGDLYIVDILLRGKASGLDLCKHLRGLSPTLPILILSALSEASDRVEGLRMGADDYLTKPFELEELVLRVDGMLKRRSWYQQLPAASSVYNWDTCGIDFVRLEGRRGFDRFPLTQKECMLMKLLIEREGQVVSRDEILDRVWGYNVYPSTRTVDNFIMRLRKHFEREAGDPKYIHSVRGMGYKFTAKS